MLKYRLTWYGQTGVAVDRRPNPSIYMLPNLVVWHTENACMVVLSVCRAWNTLCCLMECVVSLGNKFSIMFECHVWIWSICWIHNKPLMLTFYSIILCVGMAAVYCIYTGMSMTLMRHAGWTMLLNPSVISPKTTVKMVHLCFDLLRCIFALQELKFHSYGILCRRTILERVSGARWTREMVRAAENTCAHCPGLGTL